MFYYLLAPVWTYNFILIAAAIIPAAFLMFWVYRSDHLEKESPRMIWRLVIAGVLAALIALVLEKFFGFILNISVDSSSPAYNVILYFIIVAFSEEGAKYFMLWLRSWRSVEFDCQYDGVVYAVFVSLGFAVWENISYVLMYGFSTALVRAITAIPGHACFGVFMGVFYSIAKKYWLRRQNGLSYLFRVLAVIVPAVIHGAYDYIASSDAKGHTWYFVIFIAVLFAISFFLVGRMSKTDRRFR